MEIPVETQSPDKPFVSCADRYDGWFDANREIFLQQPDRVRPFLRQENGQIMEVGCGSGRFSEVLGIPYGIDLSLPLCRVANRRGLSVIRGDVVSLPVRDRALSQVFLITVPEFVKSPKTVLDEICRALIPGGSLIIVSLDTGCETCRHDQSPGAHSTFLMHARFFSLPNLAALPEETGYGILAFRCSSCLRLISGMKGRDRDRNTR